MAYCSSTERYRLVMPCWLNRVRLGYCFKPYQRLWLYNGASLVAFYDTLGIRRTYSRLNPPASSRGDLIGEKNQASSHIPILLKKRELWRGQKKICVFTVRLIFGSDPKLFYSTLSWKLFKYPIFSLQCSFCCLRDHYFDKNKLNVTLQV